MDASTFCLIRLVYEAGTRTFQVNEFFRFWIFQVQLFRFWIFLCNFMFLSSNFNVSYSLTNVWLLTIDNWFVDDIINRRNKNQPDDLFQKLNSNHPNMKSTVEVKPENFLDTKIVFSNDVITTGLKRSKRKLPVHWSSKVPKRYKRNAINSDLNKATRIISFQQMRYRKLNKTFLTRTVHIDLSIVSLITFMKNQMELTTTSFPLVSLMFWRRFY